MALTLPDSRQLSDDVLDALRLRALHGRELGYTQAQLGELLGVSRETISRWWSAYTTGGLDALPGERTGRPLGTGRMLTDTQAEYIQQILDTQTPQQKNIPAALWNRRAVRDLIQQEWGGSVGGTHRRRVPQAMGLYLEETAASRTRSRPGGGPGMAGDNVSGAGKTSGNRGR